MKNIDLSDNEIRILYHSLGAVLLVLRCPDIVGGKETGLKEEINNIKDLQSRFYKLSNDK